MNDNRILMLVDYRGTFYSSTKKVAGSMDVQKLSKLFENHGFDVRVESFTDVDFRSDRYRGIHVVYQSSEDPDLYYKDYIEDVLLGLELIGAILVPNFFKFRAHHNKVFMEILRDVSGSPLIQSLKSQSFGTLDEFKLNLDRFNLPVVIKPSAGARSQGVEMASAKGDLIRVASRISRSLSLFNVRRMFAGLVNGKGYKPISNHRRKFLVQEFVEGLSCDYKVVVYKDKFYFFRRDIKPGDFRASGTQDFTFPLEAPEGLLDYAEQIFKLFNVPFASFDIAIKNEAFHLLEFQFVSFGQRALERSEVYFTKHDGQWHSAKCFSDLEENFVDSIVWYISKQT